MKVLVSGKGGQLATELERTLPSGFQLVSLSAAELDIPDRSSVLARVASESPDLIINAAAYTMVDKAETEEDLDLRQIGGRSSMSQSFQSCGKHSSSSVCLGGPSGRKTSSTHMYFLVLI